MNMLSDTKLLDAESLEPTGDVEGGFHPLFADVPSSVEFNKLRKRLLRLTRQVIEDFAMVKPGQRWLVALSGGKDSYGLLALLPIDTSETKGPVGLTVRTDAVPTLPLSILMQTIREAANEVAKKL